MSNPLNDLPFQQEGRRQLVNDLPVGASYAVCGHKRELFDDRPYGMALQESSYPRLRELFDGRWEPHHLALANTLLHDALERGSIALAIVFALAMQGHPPERRSIIWEELSPTEQRRLEFLLALALADPDFDPVFDRPSKATS